MPHLSYTRTEGCDVLRRILEGISGSPPGPGMGGAPRVPTPRPSIHRLRHAVTPRHSYCIVKLVQRSRLPSRCRHPPPLHTCHGGWGVGGDGGMGGGLRRYALRRHPLPRSLAPLGSPRLAATVQNPKQPQITRQIDHGNRPSLPGTISVSPPLCVRGPLCVRDPYDECNVRGSEAMQYSRG